MLGAKNSINGYPTSIHLKIFWLIQLKNFDYRTNENQLSTK
jgi:hypothetical protein